MSTTTRPIVIHNENFPIAIGSIGPALRMQKHEISKKDLDAFLAELGEFYVTTATKGEAIPAQCVDGRSRKDGSYQPRPKAAAGTFSAVVGDALTSSSYRPKGGNAADHAKAVYAYFKRHGYVGGHDADHASNDGCGCGAEDKLKEILTFVRDNGTSVRSFLKDAGIAVDDETHKLVTKQAAALLNESYVVPGALLRDVFIAIAGMASIETLTGPHNEVALVINTADGTTIDRAKLAQSFGDKFQVFELDVPSLQVAANALSISPHEAQQKFAAMLYYNVATAAVLADSSLRILVR